MTMHTTTFAASGAQHFKGVLQPFLAELEAALSGVPTGDAGVRLHGIAALSPLLEPKGCTFERTIDQRQAGYPEGCERRVMGRPISRL